MLPRKSLHKVHLNYLSLSTMMKLTNGIYNKVNLSLITITIMVFAWNEWYTLKNYFWIPQNFTDMNYCTIWPLWKLWVSLKCKSIRPQTDKAAHIRSSSLSRELNLALVLLCYTKILLIYIPFWREVDPGWSPDKPLNARYQSKLSSYSLTEYTELTSAMSWVQGVTAWC